MKERLHFNRGRKLPALVRTTAFLLLVLTLATFAIVTSAQDIDRRELIRAEQPPPPCFPK